MRSNISRLKEEIHMAYFIPDSYLEITRTALHIETLEKITEVLRQRGETRRILQYWWSVSEQSYLLLLETPEGEDNAICVVSLREMTQV